MKFLSVLLSIHFVIYGIGINKVITHKQPLINSGFTELQSVNLLSGKLKLMLPADLKRLSEAELISESPIGNQRPTDIFLNKITKCKFSINYGATPAHNKDLPQIKAYFEKVYKSLASDFISSDLSTVNNKPFIIMKFELPNRSGDGKVFNFLFITTISGKLLMADYSFPSEHRLIQEKQATAILNSAIIEN